MARQFMWLAGGRRRLLVSCVTVAALGISLTGTEATAATDQPSKPRPWAARHLAEVGAQHQRAVAAARDVRATVEEPGEGEDEDESRNTMVATEEFTEARVAPGIVAPGAYGAAWAQLNRLPRVGGAWSHVTNKPYNSDDPRYRDFYSNSSGGAGFVTGRMTGLVADNHGYVYAGGANGGVFRSRTGGGHWTSISDRLPSLSTGDLRLDPKGRLWYATGEANTSATSFVGTGVYVLSKPRTGTFSTRDRVGGDELESTVINALRFAGGRVWAATSRGVWSHSTTTLTGRWRLEFAPNPDYLPGGANAGDPNAPYKNIANDIAIDPRHPDQVVLAIGWRSGDTYNGFYAKQRGTWQKITPGGDLPGDDIGNVTFAYAADGSKLYAVNQSPKNLNTNPDTALGGIYVSATGSVFGPWKLLADHLKLRASGSALQDPGYQPGIQAWYNQFLQVDPSDPNHVFLGLEEVFETKNGGTSWLAVGPYWNFPFPCWSIDPPKQTGDCFPTTHPDQHSVAIGTYRGRSYLYVGDDGGLYRRPLRGAVDSGGHAKDWTSLADGTIDTLQYYAVDIGRDRRYGGVAVSGGLQDNGGSLLRGRDRVMGSNFGGDGGDVLVDPANGCNIVQEYVYLAMRVTQNCAVNPGALEPEDATTYDIAPPDNEDAGAGARFIAPFVADDKDINAWVAGGRHVWYQGRGFAIRSGEEWKNIYDLGEGHVATAVASAGGKVYVGWCGPCNNQGFARGIAVGNIDGTGWHQLTLPVDGTVPNRFVSAFTVDPKDNRHVYVAMNGFSRRWTEGPGAGFGHVFESRDSGATWRDISANLPDVPANSIKLLRNGGLVLGTDLAALYRAPGRSTWARLGSGLPTTTVIDLELGPNGLLYAGTHGRGIWSTDPSRLRR